MYCDATNCVLFDIQGFPEITVHGDILCRFFTSKCYDLINDDVKDIVCQTWNLEIQFSFHSM